MAASSGVEKRVRNILFFTVSAKSDKYSGSLWDLSGNVSHAITKTRRHQEGQPVQKAFLGVLGALVMKNSLF
jgi:hypothetical protein